MRLDKFVMQVRYELVSRYWTFIVKYFFISDLRVVLARLADGYSQLHPAKYG